MMENPNPNQKTVEAIILNRVSQFLRLVDLIELEPIFEANPGIAVENLPFLDEQSYQIISPDLQIQNKLKGGVSRIRELPDKQLWVLIPELVKEGEPEPKRPRLSVVPVDHQAPISRGTKTVEEDLISALEKADNPEPSSSKEITGAEIKETQGTATLVSETGPQEGKKIQSRKEKTRAKEEETRSESNETEGEVKNNMERNVQSETKGKPETKEEKEKRERREKAEVAAESARSRIIQYSNERQASVVNYDKFDEVLIEFLQNNAEGLIVVGYYQQHNTLSPKTREYLVMIICRELLLKKITYLSMFDYIKIVTGVLKIFPGEAFQVYYIAARTETRVDGTVEHFLPSGKLYIKFQNLKKEFQAVGYIEINKKKETVGLPRINRPEETTDDRLQYLKLHSSEEEIEKITELWAETRELRLNRSINQTPAEVVEAYAPLRSPNGYIWIEKDFEAKYGRDISDVISESEKFAVFFEKIKNFEENAKKKSPQLKAYLNILAVEGLSEEVKDLYRLLSLPFFLPAKIKLCNNRKVTTGESSKHFVNVIHSNAELDQFQTELQTIAAEEKRNVNPAVAVLQQGRPNEIDAVYLIFGSV